MGAALGLAVAGPERADRQAARPHRQECRGRCRHGEEGLVAGTVHEHREPEPGDGEVERRAHAGDERQQSGEDDLGAGAHDRAGADHHEDREVDEGRPFAAGDLDEAERDDQEHRDRRRDPSHRDGTGGGDHGEDAGVLELEVDRGEEGERRDDRPDHVDDDRARGERSDERAPFRHGSDHRTGSCAARPWAASLPVLTPPGTSR
ncbi:hypothetical protein [Curtobacterium luteum]|uniref:hypothetical protein n=1 Tax=Curtobacterium luteum TaxID=33881 RepID=UPI001666D690|nr:hypothetical protein [Curtobacterium luteum]